jgi:hypothetical protein
MEEPRDSPSKEASHDRQCECFKCAPLNHCFVYKNKIVQYFCKRCKKDLLNTECHSQDRELRSGTRYHTNGDNFCTECVAVLSVTCPIQK